MLFVSFAFVACAFGILSKKKKKIIAKSHVLHLSPMFSSQGFMLLGPTFKSLVNVEGFVFVFVFVFLYGVS